MIVEDLRISTSRRLAAIAATATVRIAASALSQLHVGLLVVCNADGTVAGVVSNSDLVRHLAAEGHANTSLPCVMTTDILACSLRDSVRDIWQEMADRRVKNAPVLNAHRRPVGVLDVRDALEALLKEEQLREQQLVNYVAGIGYR
jgi:CBS domain-containing protein